MKQRAIVRTCSACKPRPCRSSCLHTRPPRARDSASRKPSKSCFKMWFPRVVVISQCHCTLPSLWSMISVSRTKTSNSVPETTLPKIAATTKSTCLLPLSTSTRELLPETVRSGSPCPTLELLAVDGRGASGGSSTCSTASPSGSSTSLCSKLGGSAVPARGDVSSELHHSIRTHIQEDKQVHSRPARKLCPNAAELEPSLPSPYETSVAQLPNALLVLHWSWRW